MCRRSADRTAASGFTLVEAIIALTVLIIVLVLSMTLLFTMRNFADAQQLTAEPRQTARRALDFLLYNGRGCTDMNPFRGNPNAIVIWYRISAVDTQASYNNLTGAETGNGMQDADTTNFGDLGTDLITVAAPNNNGLNIEIVRWVGADLNAANSWNEFRAGCPDDAANMEQFMNLTGTCGQICGPAFFPCNCQSAVLTVVDYQGNWTYWQITGYQASDCSDPDREIIHVVANPGLSDHINPPGGPGDILDPPVYIAGGIMYVAFRVKNETLEMKNGLFNPNLDNGGAGDGFFPLLENVEDFQVAYIFNDGSVWNTATQTLPGAQNFVPLQDPSAHILDPPPQPLDIRNVMGLRLTITARSPRVVPGIMQDRYSRPASEDHAAGVRDRFIHYSMTATAMVRNRMRGS